jgi:phosphate:Na+ symporter
VFYAWNAGRPFLFLEESADSAGIAVVHTAFNLAATLLLLPFSRWLEWLAVHTIPEGDEAESLGDPDLALLDERFLEHPAFAVAQVGTAVADLAERVHEMLTLALSLPKDYHKKKVKRILRLMEQVKACEQPLGAYLLRLCTKPLSEQDNRQLMRLLQQLGELERLAGHGAGLAGHAKDSHRIYGQFSKKAAAELNMATKALEGILDQTFLVLSGEEPVGKPLADLDMLTAELAAHNRKRILKGKCTAEAGVALTELLTDYERIAAHCCQMAQGLYV